MERLEVEVVGDRPCQEALCRGIQKGTGAGLRFVLISFQNGRIVNICKLKRKHQ